LRGVLRDRVNTLSDAGRHAARSRAAGSPPQLNPRPTTTTTCRPAGPVPHRARRVGKSEQLAHGAARRYVETRPPRHQCCICVDGRDVVCCSEAARFNASQLNNERRRPPSRPSVHVGGGVQLTDRPPPPTDRSSRIQSKPHQRNINERTSSSSSSSSCSISCCCCCCCNAMPCISLSACSSSETLARRRAGGRRRVCVCVCVCARVDRWGTCYIAR